MNPGVTDIDAWHERRQHGRSALLIETSNAYARGLLRGVRAFAQEHGRWSTYLVEHGRGDPPPRWIRDWKGDGIIARIENRTIARAIKATGLPVVDVSAARLVPAAPWVETDDGAIARAVVDHLAERGFDHFAYCGDSRFKWSGLRQQCFAELVAARGRKCHALVTEVDDAEDPERQQRAIARWIKKLPNPIGIMACYDIRGRQVIDACRAVGVAVPDEVAVIGVDNDELLCDLSDPPLSSVIPDSHRTGYAAAELLEQMMRGRAVDASGLFIPPLGVATRRSTDVLAIGDPHVVSAMRYIRDHACDGINVEDVLRHVPVSRRILESRFRSHLGRTPHQQIARLQLDRAKQLLRDTDLPARRHRRPRRVQSRGVSLRRIQKIDG